MGFLIFLQYDNFINLNSNMFTITLTLSKKPVKYLQTSVDKF